MFEINDGDILVATDIGPQKKSAMIMDNFYKDPDSVRELCLKSKEVASADNSDLPGPRAAVPVEGLTENLKPLFQQLCSDVKIWGKTLNQKSFDNSWMLSEFICNYLNDETILNKPVGILPHQDSYFGEEKLAYWKWKNVVQHEAGYRIDEEDLIAQYRRDEANFPTTQFGVVIYLNTPEECQGGTNLYSLDDVMTLDIPPQNTYGIITDENGRVSYNVDYKDIKKSMEPGGRWKVEHEFEMVYNRCILYQADVLHGQNIDYGMFTDYDRINQVLFL